MNTSSGRGVPPPTAPITLAPSIDQMSVAYLATGETPQEEKASKKKLTDEQSGTAESEAPAESTSSAGSTKGVSSGESPKITTQLAAGVLAGESLTRGDTIKRTEETIRYDSLLIQDHEPVAPEQLSPTEMVEAYMALADSLTMPVQTAVAALPALAILGMAQMAVAAQAAGGAAPTEESTTASTSGTTTTSTSTTSKTSASGTSSTTTTTTTGADGDTTTSTTTTTTSSYSSGAFTFADLMADLAVLMREIDKTLVVQQDAYMQSVALSADLTRDSADKIREAADKTLMGAYVMLGVSGGMAAASGAFAVYGGAQSTATVKTTTEPTTMAVNATDNAATAADDAAWAAQKAADAKAASQSAQVEADNKSTEVDAKQGIANNKEMLARNAETDVRLKTQTREELDGRAKYLDGEVQKQRGIADAKGKQAATEREGGNSEAAAKLEAEAKTAEGKAGEFEVKAVQERAKIKTLDEDLAVSRPNADTLRSEANAAKADLEKAQGQLTFLKTKAADLDDKAINLRNEASAKLEHAETQLNAAEITLTREGVGPTMKQNADVTLKKIEVTNKQSGQMSKGKQVTSDGEGATVAGSTPDALEANKAAHNASRNQTKSLNDNLKGDFSAFKAGVANNWHQTYTFYASIPQIGNTLGQSAGNMGQQLYGVEAAEMQSDSTKLQADAQTQSSATSTMESGIKDTTDLADQYRSTAQSINSYMSDTVRATKA